MERRVLELKHTGGHFLVRELLLISNRSKNEDIR